MISLVFWTLQFDWLDYTYARICGFTRDVAVIIVQYDCSLVTVIDFGTPQMKQKNHGVYNVIKTPKILWIFCSLHT